MSVKKQSSKKKREPINWLDGMEFSEMVDYCGGRLSVACSRGSLTPWCTAWFSQFINSVMNVPSVGRKADRLLGEMAELTKPACGRDCGKVSEYRCCSPEYCQMVMQIAKEDWNTVLIPVETRLNLLITCFVKVILAKYIV